MTGGRPDRARRASLFALQGMLLALLAFPDSVYSQDLKGLQSFGECRTGYWSSSRNLDDVEDLGSSTCLLNLKLQPVANLRLAANTRLSHAYGSEGSSFRGRLREAYAQAELGDVTLKLGRQIVVWGRSDRISPTDLVSSRDFTARVPDDDEQRDGNDIAAARWQVSSDVAATFLVGRFEGHRVPTGSLPANLVTLGKPNRPEYAAKIDRVGAGVDFSVSYFDGFDKAARYEFIQAGLVGRFQRHHERVQMAGFDFSTSTGRWTLRGEAAAFRMTSACTLCIGETLPPRKIQRAVLGVDRDFFDTTNLNFQFFILERGSYKSTGSLQGTQRLVADALDRLNSEFGAVERGLTLRLSERFFNDLLKLEASGLFDLNNNSQLLRARGSYAVNDQVKIYAGVDSFRGQDQSYFGSRRKNSTAFIELAWVF